MSNQDWDVLLMHYGVKGMHWGIRKRYLEYQVRAHSESPGAIKTVVTTKHGETISIEKAKPGPLALAVGKLQGAKPSGYLSSMVIRDKTGAKVGSFQVWREGKSSVRGEWLSIDKEVQGRGYSKAAIEGLIVAAKKDPSVETVRLQVPSDAQAAQHIYASLGFSKEQDLGNSSLFGNLEDWVLNI